MIEMGLLWYEPGVPLEERVDTAAERYLAKFGIAPNVALANPNEMKTLDRIAVRADKRCGFGHLLIGVDPDITTGPWRPLRRASDDVEVVVYGSDGTPLSALKPNKGRRKVAPSKPVPTGKPEPVEVSHVVIASKPHRRSTSASTVPSLTIAAPRPKRVSTGLDPKAVTEPTAHSARSKAADTSRRSDDSKATKGPTVETVPSAFEARSHGDSEHAPRKRAGDRR